jgi:hypothetical protein
MIFTQHHIKVMIEEVWHFERGAVVLHNLKAKAGLGRIGYEGGQDAERVPMGLPEHGGNF